MKDVFAVIILALILISGLVIFLIAWEPEGQSAYNPGFRKESNENKRLLKDLSLEQKIGQLFIIGIEGTEFNSETEKLIKEVHPAGILLLEKNIKDENQLKNLIDSFQKTALEDMIPPLFIAVDQEGGLISRIDWLEKTAQFEIKHTEQAYQIGKKRGKELKNLGINLNLAPVLDSASPSDFIFNRTFQLDCIKTGDLAESLARGQEDAGIMVCIKHFPGYGGISFNPEEKLAFLDKIPEIFQFKKLVGQEPEMVMVSNAVYRELDDKKPFIFSHKGIQFLRENLSDDILIISDDLAQNSLLSEFSLNEIVSSPIKAGADILIFSGRREPLF